MTELTRGDPAQVRKRLARMLVATVGGGIVVSGVALTQLIAARGMCDASLGCVSRVVLASGALLLAMCGGLLFLACVVGLVHFIRTRAIPGWALRTLLVAQFAACVGVWAVNRFGFTIHLLPVGASGYAAIEVAMIGWFAKPRPRGP